MWIVKVEDSFVKTDDPEKISNYLVKNMKKLKNIVDLKDPRLLAAIEACLETPDYYKVETVTHEIKLKKMDKGIEFTIYMKIPSVKTKMKIQEHILDIEIINVDNLKSLD